MTTRADNGGGSTGRRRVAAWGGAVGLILMPLVAMRFTNEVNWGAGDFILAAALLVGAGVTFELAARVPRGGAYRAATAVALATALFMTWSTLSIGIIGSEENPANLMFWGVLAVGAAGAAVARFEPAALARAMLAAGIGQVGAFAIALIAGFGSAGPVTVVFVALWLLSAWLFRKAAAEQAGATRQP